jgi:pyruvate dehydrogenase E2 component (dihydrolipoamide acetyltransferase)
MPTDVVMPQMGESIFEGTITKWLKQPGDKVTRDEPLFEISTDKVDAEIPAPASGVLKTIMAEEGKTVQVNSVVAVIDESGATDAAAANGNSKPPKTASATSIGSPEPTPAASPAPDSLSASSGPATDVVMPQMGESIFEGTIAKWLKKVGEQVTRDEPLFEISTDKVDAEIPAPVSGILTAIKAETGQTVQVNSVVGVIGGTGASPAGPDAATAPAAASAAESMPPASAHEPETATGEEVRSSPLVRKLATENNVDLRQVSGSGAGGRVTKDDILAFVERVKTAPTAAPIAATPMAEKIATTPAAAAPGKFAGKPGVVEPMSVMRKKIAEHMLNSRRTSAHVHTVFDVDMTRIVKLRDKNKNRFLESTGLKLTYTPFFIRAVALGLRAWPIMNSSVEGENIHYKRDINIGIAVALDWGLLVPVIKHADELSYVGLQRALNDLGERAKSKKLKPDEVSGGTFTITNPGIFGANFGLPIINQPQVAILDLGAIVKKAVVLTDKEGNDTIAIRSMITMAIGFDHRVVDGAVADQFMLVVKSVLENWNEAI